MKPGQVKLYVTMSEEGSIAIVIGDEDSGHRLAGPKSWGLCKTIHTFDVDVEELIEQAIVHGAALLEKNPDYGYLFTAQRWLECVEDQVFTPFDGSGYWATETHHSMDHSAFKVQPHWATHVIWFNN